MKDSLIVAVCAALLPLPALAGTPPETGMDADGQFPQKMGSSKHNHAAMHFVAHSTKAAAKASAHAVELTGAEVVSGTAMVGHETAKGVASIGHGLKRAV